MQSANFYTTITFLALLNFACNSSYGQAKFLPGYIIKPNGDTLYGLIDYRNWSVNPEKISFKKQPKDDKSVCTSDDIIGFGVAGEIYIKAIVGIDESKTNTNDLEYTAEVNPVYDTVFLQTLVHGNKSMYYYKNKSVKDQFYIGKGPVYELLIYKRYFRNTLKQNTEKSFSENKMYLYQLAVYLNDCPDIQNNFKSLDYSKESLEKLFLRYYNCTQSKMQYKVKPKKIKIETGALAGISITSVRFTGSKHWPVVNTEYQPSLNFTGGLYLNLFPPGNTDKISWNNELQYTSFNIDGSCYTDYYNENEYTLHTTSIGLKYLKLNSMIRYNQPVGNAIIFLNAGFSVGFVISDINYYKREKVQYTDIQTYESLAIYALKKYELCYNVGIGTKYKKISFECRYERGNGMSQSVNLEATTNRLYFLLGYTF
jgi:hypothetical protein